MQISMIPGYFNCRSACTFVYAILYAGILCDVENLHVNIRIYMYFKTYHDINDYFHNTHVSFHYRVFFQPLQQTCSSESQLY